MQAEVELVVVIRSVAIFHVLSFHVRKVHLPFANLMLAVAFLHMDSHDLEVHFVVLIPLYLNYLYSMAKLVDYNLHKLVTRSQQVFISTPCIYMCNKNT